MSALCDPWGLVPTLVPCLSLGFRCLMWCTMHARVYSWILICDFRIPGSERGVCSVCKSVCVVSGVFCLPGCVCACAFWNGPSRLRAFQGDANLVGCYIPVCCRVCFSGVFRSLSLAPIERHRRLTHLLSSGEHTSHPVLCLQRALNLPPITLTSLYRGRCMCSQPSHPSLK